MPNPAVQPAFAPTVAAPRLHLAFLDGLRAVAALFVVINHLWNVHFRSPFPGWRGVFTNWLGNGHLWVNVFIVLSGFCLMLPVAKTRSLRGGWQAFYRSRARRILPPLYAAMGLALLLGLISHEKMGTQTVLVNLFLLQDIVQLMPPLDGPLWSVALEWKIYFLFPALVWFWRRFGVPSVLLASGVVSLLLLFVYTASHTIVHMSLACPWYIFLFVTGMAGADFARRNTLPPRAENKAWLLFAASAAAGALSPLLGHISLGSLHTAISDALHGLTVSALLFLLTRMATDDLTRQDWKTKALHSVLAFLSWKPLVFVGTFSYSIYLIHILVIYRLEGFLAAHLHTSSALVLFPIIVVLVVPMAYVFHLAFERPFLSKPGQVIQTETQAEAAALVSPAP